MSLRKNRIACQGLNNLSQTELITNRTAPYLKLTNKTAFSSPSLPKTKPLPHKISKYDAQNIQKTTEHDFVADKGTRTDQDWHVQKIDHTQGLNDAKKSHTLLHSKLSKAPKSLDQKQPKAPQKVQFAIEQIRNLYKYNANVKKIIKAWGFQNNGCISDQKFQQMLATHFDPTITKQDCQQLFSNFSGDKSNLDLLSFMKVIFDQEPFTKPRINVLDPSIKSRGKESELPKTLVSKIQNLNETGLLKELKLNMNKSECEGEGLKKDGRKSCALKMAGSQSMSRLAGEASLHQTLWSQANPKYSFITTKSHGVEFVPTQFLGKSTYFLKLRPAEDAIRGDSGD